MRTQDAVCDFMNKPIEVAHSFTQLMAVAEDKATLVGYQPEYNSLMRYMVVKSTGDTPYVAVNKYGKLWRADQSAETRGNYVLFDNANDRLKWMMKGELPCRI